MKSFTIFCLVATALAAPSKMAAAPTANCTQFQTQLEKGIQANLDIQAQELKGVQSLAHETGAAEFTRTKQSVLAIQQKGITIRQNNQKLAKKINSPATDGLATVAGAQVLEMMQVMGLNGTCADKATLATLMKEVVDGTAQNHKNLAAAQGQNCKK